MARTAPAGGAKSIERHCTPGTPPLQQVLPRSSGESAIAEEYPALDGFSPDASRLASALGLAPLLRHMIQLQSEPVQHREGAALQLLRLHHQILSRLVLADHEVSRIAAEVRCEHARVDDLADSLGKRQQTRSNTENIIANILQGATNVATGALSIAAMAISEGLAGIVGGTLSGGFGALPIIGQVEHDMRHERNLLRAIREEKEGAALLPTSVWRLLTVPRKDRQTLRDQLLEAWQGELQELETQTQQKRPRADLLFGNGGVYGIEELHTRATMLEMLAATLDLISEDLEVLLREVMARDIGP